LTRAIDKIQDVFTSNSARKIKRAESKEAKAELQMESEAAKTMLSTLRDQARVQDEFNRRIWGQYAALAPPHAPTHMGGNDTVSGNGLPSPVGPTSVARRGTPQLGFSPHDHIHPWEGGALDDLLDLDVTPDGVPVFDSSVRRLLEAILRRLRALFDLLSKLLDLLKEGDVLVPTESVVFPSLPASTASQLAVPARAERISVTIYNDAGPVMFIKYGSGASSTSYTYRIQGNTQWDMPANHRYVGDIHVAWNSASAGNCKVTELVRLR